MALIPTAHIKTIIIRYKLKPVSLSPIITTVIQINKLDKQKSLNIGHSYYNECRPITTTWPSSVNDLGRIQLDEIHTQATNKTTTQLLYSHYVGKHLDNDVSLQH